MREVGPFAVEHERIPVQGDKAIIMGMSHRENGVSRAPFQHLNMGFHVGDDGQDVIVNRQKFAEWLHIPLETWIGAEQVHGNHVVNVGAEDVGRGARSIETAIQGTDGMYTNHTGILLTACFADCVPLYFYHKDDTIVGLAHAGWRGTTSEIAGQIINGFNSKLGIHPKDIHAVIGPSIQSCCYEVDDRVISAVQAIDGLSPERVYQSNQAGKYQMSLQALNRMILEKYGVPSEQIRVSKVCTSCHTDLLYSHRKENGHTGRMLSYIGIVGGE
ncbi:peptidoglycan editing factor PgeF [Tuberibacillus sp. Marseille-P3662]|uniref:peptidoglycan editing factor PgeF n=1 Tax=Tuberibacillus sp. Marseille-P3662 TaxID=1965358 RepID=UPI000A1C9557|nr:peptidoglycan editing factor PgeF [Tuberibacillus sp. Marseille-P3662]